MDVVEETGRRPHLQQPATMMDDHSVPDTDIEMTASDGTDSSALLSVLKQRTKKKNKLIILYSNLFFSDS